MQINIFFNKLRAVWHIFASEVLHQIRDEHGHHVPKLDFVEFIYIQVVITLFLYLLLCNTCQYVFFSLKLGVQTGSLMNFWLIILLLFDILA